MGELLWSKKFFILLCVATISMPIKACMAKETQRSPTDHYRSSLYFDNLLELLKEEDTSSFTGEVDKFLEPEAPSLEDLTNIFTEIEQGTLPQYLKDNDYNLTANSSTTYNYSSSNTGEIKAFVFSRLRSQGNIGTLSAIETSFITGQAGNYSYNAGISVFIHAKYTKGESFLNFQSSVLASFTSKLPSGIYVSYGNFTGMAEGNAASNSKGVIEQSVKTLGILHNSMYYSKSVIVSNAKNKDESGKNVFRINSLTGGTNATLNLQETLLPHYKATIIGTLRNQDKEATMTAQSETFLTFNSSDPFGDDQLLGYLWVPRMGIDVYIP